jgi:hypothetical protein
MANFWATNNCTPDALLIYRCDVFLSRTVRGHRHLHDADPLRAKEEVVVMLAV